MEIHTPRLLLREFEESDLEALRQLENCPEMHRYEGESVPADDTIRKYLQNARMCAGVSPRTHYHFAVVPIGQTTLRGKVSLSLLHVDIREWEIGWSIHPADWGRGYAAEAGRAVLDLAFRRLEAHRVVAFCHAHNLQSVRVMEKLGMQQDGLLRATRRWGGGWADERVFAILESEWPAASGERTTG